MARTPARRAGPAPAVDLARILREEVVPALVRRGALTPGERVVVDERPPGTATPPPAPPPGTARLAVTPPRRSAPAVPPPPPPLSMPPRSPADVVQVLIDQIVVTRAPAPPPPPPAPAPPPPRSTVDHRAYLARRREDR